ncbi:MAG: hypothetical protein HC913_00315 [Microscillaceae bacterium]|nr:hypothetical protein [Microscillaceae bacterium]
MDWEEEAEFEEHLRKELGKLRPEFKEALWQKMEARLNEKPPRVEKSWQFFLRRYQKQLLLGFCLLVWLCVMIANFEPSPTSSPISWGFGSSEEGFFPGRPQNYSENTPPAPAKSLKEEDEESKLRQKVSLFSMNPAHNSVQAFSKPTSPASETLLSSSLAAKPKPPEPLPPLSLTSLPVVLPDVHFPQFQIDSLRLPVVKPRSRRWSVYLGGGPEWVYAPTALDMSPQSSGQCWLEYALSPHWRLRTGMAYLRQKVDLQNTGNVAVQITTIQPAPDRILNNIQFQREEALLMRELEIPFVLQYERPLGRNFYCYAGAGAGLNLQLEEKYEYTVSEILVDAINGQRLNFENTTQEREASRQLRVGLLLNMGIGWQPAPGWKIAIEPHFRHILGNPQLAQTLGTRILLGYSL